MTPKPTVRVNQRVPEIITELVERIENLEQALILTQSVVVEATERLDDIEEAFEFEEQPEEEPSELAQQRDPEPERQELPQASREELGVLARIQAAEAHEAAKRAASQQPLVIDGQTVQQQPVSDEPTLTPEQIAEKANSTVQEYMPTDPIEAANSAPVPDEGIFVDQGRAPGTDIQRHYDDRGNPLDDQ